MWHPLGIAHSLGGMPTVHLDIVAARPTSPGWNEPAGRARYGHLKHRSKQVCAARGDGEKGLKISGID
eukprot:6199094-Pleurochrysis_carterae.AAC.4